MKTFHLRFTPYDISGYSFTWLDRYNKYIVAQEDIDDDGNPLLHYHILIESDKHPDTIRDMLKIKLLIPKNNGKGVNNKHYALIPDWKDPGYICKYNNVIFSKNYSEKEIMEFVISGKKRYLEKVETTPAENSVTADQLSHIKKPRKIRLTFCQEVMSIAEPEWYKYKREALDNQLEYNPKQEIIKIVIKAIREKGKGINPYQVRDFVYAIMSDDPEYLDNVVQQIYSLIKI